MLLEAYRCDTAGGMHFWEVARSLRCARWPWGALHAWAWPACRALIPRAGGSIWSPWGCVVEVAELLL